MQDFEVEKRINKIFIKNIYNNEIIEIKFI